MAPSIREEGECEPPGEPHAAHLFRSTSHLRRVVAQWIVPSLLRGGMACLVSTPRHAAKIRSGIRDEGLDPRAYERDGRLVVLDAEKTLARILENGRPDAARFENAVGEMVAALRARSPDGASDVRVWGEMVNLLWRRGQPEAALELEVLWNRLIRRYGFRLLCSYEVLGADGPEMSSLLGDVARTHTHVFLEHEDGRHPPAPGSPVGPPQASIWRG